MIKIGNKEIGGKRAYIIAEYGVNHNGSYERACEGIRAAKAAGADAIKFQTYTADELVVKGTPKFWDWDGDKKHATQYDAYKAIGGFSLEHYAGLRNLCEELEIEFLSTPFSIEGADFLNKLGVRAFKVASSDMSCLPFLRHIAKFQKPILLSTGAATGEEIMQAVETIAECGNQQVIILQCTLCYPTKEEDANWQVIRSFESKQTPLGSYPVGVSDHTLGIFPSIIAVAAGARVVEKHFTTDKTLPESADHWLSIDPPELKELVTQIRRIETLMGNGQKKVLLCEAPTRQFDKRSIVSKIDIAKGSIITEEMLTYKRPGTGIWPEGLDMLIGTKAAKNIPADTILQWPMFK